VKLTLKSVADAQLPAGTTDTVFWDDDIKGFGLRIRQGGNKTWIYRCRLGKKQFSISLGNAKSVPLVMARQNAAQCEAKIRLGGNPTLEKQAAIAEVNNTVGPLIDQYLDERQSEWRPNSLREVKRHLLVYAKPLHGLPINAVSQRSVSNLLTDIAKSSGEVTSNRLRASLSTFLSWTIRQGIKLPDGNVASSTLPKRERSRERVLNDAEIKAVWQACDDDTDHSHILKLLLLTGQRAAEIGSLRWDEVWGDQIVLPGERTKNKRPHIIPLSPPAQAILHRLKVADRSLVFGRDDAHGFAGWAVSKARLDQRIAKANGAMAPWVVHDIRRTCVTGMYGLGIQPHIVEAVVNHVSGHRSGVAGVYNKATYSPEKREALNRWAEHVLAVAGAA
jgi:integrase